MCIRDRLKSLLSGDLDWVVMKALDKEPNRRYASVGDLAEDVNRFLSGLPVSARAPSRACLLYTSDAADERSSVDLGGRRII